MNVHGSTPSGVATPATETTPGPSSSVTSFALDSRAPPSAPASKEKDDEEERQREAKEEKEIEDLIHQTRIWRVSNSAQWVAWGIVQAKVPGMDEALDKKRVEIQAKQRSMSRRVWEKLSGKSGTAKKAGAEDEEGSMEDMEGLEPTKGGEDKPNIPHEHETDDDAEFDYLAYAQERALFFWGDILELGIVQESDLPAELVKAAKRVPY